MVNLMGMIHIVYLFGHNMGSILGNL